MIRGDRIGTRGKPGLDPANDDADGDLEIRVEKLDDGRAAAHGATASLSGRRCIMDLLEFVLVHSQKVLQE